MTNVRLIARMDIKGPSLIKGIHLEGLRVIGDPQVYAKRYYDQGADEILYVDSVASLYGRNNLVEIVSRAASDIFVPLTVAGGVRSVDDAQRLLRAGADKVALNTQAVETPELISRIAERFGTQCVVLSIEAKKTANGQWKAYTHGGREPSNLDVREWAMRGQELGAGEILLTSIDREGTRKGYEIDLTRQVTSAVSIPVIASGGFGKVDDLIEVVKSGGVQAVAFADCLHYNRLNIPTIREGARAAGIPVRCVR